MKKFAIILILLLFSITSQSIPDCINRGGEFPFWVYDTNSKLFLGVSGYSSLELCQKAINTRHLGMVCAPANTHNGSLYGSVIVSTRTGQIIGYENYFFTSVNYCSQAISNIRGNTVCIPSSNGISLFDFNKNQILGKPYSSVEFCKYASSSASFSNSDPYICTMNSKGSTEILDRNTNLWTGFAFLAAKQCNKYLEGYRNYKNR